MGAINFEIFIINFDVLRGCSKFSSIYFPFIMIEISDGCIFSVSYCGMPTSFVWCVVNIAVSYVYYFFICSHSCDATNVVSGTTNIERVVARITIDYSGFCASWYASCLCGVADMVCVVCAVAIYDCSCCYSTNSPNTSVCFRMNGWIGYGTIVDCTIVSACNDSDKGASGIGYGWSAVYL